MFKLSYEEEEFVHTLITIAETLLFPAIILIRARKGKGRFVRLACIAFRRSEPYRS